MGPESYIRSLFTTSQSIVGLWRSQPNYHGHESSFASTRSAGYTDYSDPDYTSSGYYRSLVTKPTLTSGAVTDAIGDTGLDPATFVVPGRGIVTAASAPLMATASSDPAAPDTLSLPAGTRLKLIANGVPANPGDPATIQVVGLDDPSIVGYVLRSDIAPKDSRAPVLLAIDAGAGRFSPNGNGAFETQTVAGVFSEVVAWTVSFRDRDGNVLDTATGNGRVFSVTWDGRVNGSVVPDGAYSWTVSGTDAWLNGTSTGGGQVVVDTVAPAATGLSPDAATTTVFSPNGDGVRDTAVTAVTVSEGGSIAVRVTNATGTTVRTFGVASAAGATSVSWDGKSNAGTVVPDGTYTISFTPRDAVVNAGPSVTRQVTIVNLLGFVATSAPIFYPQDLDRLASTVTLSVRVTRPAHVTWTILDRSGAVVATHLANAPIGAGTLTWVFNGRRNDGSMLPVGTYTSSVTATDGPVTINQSRSFQMNAFSINPSTTALHRGTRLTVSSTFAEPLSTATRLFVYQPGLAMWSVPMTKIDSRHSRVTITLKTGGSTGVVTFRIYAKDIDGRGQATNQAFALT